MKKIVANILVAALCVSTWAMGSGPRAQAGSLTTFAKLEYGFGSASADIEPSTDAKDYTLNRSKYGSKSGGYTFTTGKGTLYASIDGSSKRKLEWTENAYKCTVNGKDEREPAMTAGKKNPWVSGSVPYFEIDTTTDGYTDVNFSAYIGASKKGPKYYRLSYAVGSSNSFTAITGTGITLSDNKLMTKISGKLPSAANDQGTVKIRVEVSSLKPVGTSQTSLLDDPTSGEATINHIVLQGEKKTSKNTSDNTSYTGNSNTGSSGSNTTTTNTETGTTSTATTSKKVSGISCSVKALTMKKGQKKKLAIRVNVSPKTAANLKAVKDKLTYKSSNKKIVYVNKKGVLKAKKKGTVTITVTYSKKIKAACKVSSR